MSSVWSYTRLLLDVNLATQSLLQHGNIDNPRTDSTTFPSNEQLEVELVETRRITFFRVVNGREGQKVCNEGDTDGQ